jgi:hypothetical protein
MKHYAIIALLAVGAITCYISSVHLGVVLFAIAGVFLEGAFWIKLFRGDKNTPSKN